MPSFDVQHTLRDYGRIVFRRKWRFLIPFVIAIAVAAAAFVWTPKRYMAEALVLREDPVLLQVYGEGRVSQRLDEGLGLARERLTSSVALLELLTGPEVNYQGYLRIEAKLPADWKDTQDQRVRALQNDPRWDAVVRRVRRRLSFRSRGQERGGGRQYIAISYEDEEPRLALSICEQVALKYVSGAERNIYDRFEAAERVLKRQLEVAVKEREQARTALDAFIKGHLQRWPVDGPALAQEWSRRQASAEQQKRLIENTQREVDELARKIKATPQDIVIGREFVRNPRLDEIEMDIRRYENELRELRIKYTDEHPRIVEVLRIVETLKQERTTVPAEIPKSRTEGRNPLWEQLNAEHERKTREVEALKNHLQDLEAGAAAVFQKVEEVVQSDRDWKRLEEGFRKSDGEVRRLEEKIQQNKDEWTLHDRNEGIRYQMVEAPREPRSPVSPDPFALLLMGVLGGLAVGTGFVVLAERMDHSVRTVGEANRYLHVPVVGTIGVIRTPFQRRLVALRRILCWTILGLILVAAGTTAYILWHDYRDAVERFLRDPAAEIHRWTGARS